MTTEPVLSVAETLERMAGDKILVTNLYQLFMTDAPNKLRQIEEMFQQEDYCQVERTSHAFKGASATVGALQLNKVAAALEQAAKAQDRQAMSHLIAELARACTQTLAEMREQCDS